MVSDPDLEARMHGAVGHPEHPEHPHGRHLGEVVGDDDPAGDGGSGPLPALLAQLRRPPVLIVAAAVAGFVLARLVKRAARRRGGR